jgi:battenin
LVVWSVTIAALRSGDRSLTLGPTGLINNVLYVIILSAALDLVGPKPKGIVLLADIMPSFLAKLVAPYFIHKIPYQVRVLGFVVLSTAGMLIIALTPESQDDGIVGAKMTGVVLASLSSGAGELSFLGLTHFYGQFALASWGSGTGGAGLIGAGAYALATNAMGLSSRTSLLVFSFLPVIMLISFFVVLPLGPMKRGRSKQTEYRPIDQSEEEETERTNDESTIEENAEAEALLSSSMQSSGSRSFSSLPRQSNSAWEGFKMNLSRARGLVIP